MTPQELKDSIVQLALQGKIVRQFPEDGTGEEAIKKAIRTVHSVRASYSSDDYTLDLPESWTWAKLSEITSDESLNDGNWVLSKDMATTGPVKLIQLGSIGNCKYKDKGFKYLTEEHFRELNGRQIYGGYLLVNRLIGDRMLACILPSIEGILMTAVDVCWIAPNNEIYDLRYLMYALTSSDFQSKVKALGRGTTRFRISKLNLIDISFPFPPLAEQKRIVAKIEELLPLIDRYEAAWSRLEEFNKRFPGDMQKSILQLAIQGKLVEQCPEEGTGEELYNQIQIELQALIKAKRFRSKQLPEINEDELPFDIPSSWKWVRLGNIISIESGKNLTSAQMREGSIPVYGGNGITGYHDEALIHQETVVIGRVGFYCGSVHVTEKEAWITDNAFITTYAEQSIDRDFLVYMLRHMNLGKDNNATAQPVVSGKKVYPLVFPLPPLAEQKRIVAKLEELLPLCEKIKA